MTLTEDQTNANWLRTFKKHPVLYVRDRNGRVTPLQKAVTPGGHGQCKRNKWGQVEVVNEAGAYIGILVYYSATAWLEIKDGRRIQVAYRAPSGNWQWHPIQAEEV